MTHIYYGDGKGKTSAAIGAGMRAYGAGMKVLFVQFLKDNQSSELGVLPFEVYPAPEKLPFHPGKEYQPWVDSALDAVMRSDADMLILDEFLDIIGSFTDIKTALEIVGIGDKEVILTGHTLPDELAEKADYITLMEKKKHPYDTGVFARKGIEY